jgi:hypothetical protein
MNRIRIVLLDGGIDRTGGSLARARVAGNA